MPSPSGLPRRTLLRGGATLAASAFLPWPGAAAASDVALADRVERLYSNQLAFDRNGEPQISVGLVQGVSEVVVEAPAGLHLLPSGGGGTRIECGATVRMRVRSSEAAQQHFAVVLAGFAPTAIPELDAAAARWKRLGESPREVEVGALFGVGGHTIDARRRLLVSGSFSSERAAADHARVLSARHGATGQLHPVVQRRGAGALVAEDLTRDVRVTAEAVLYVAAADGGPITLRAADSPAAGGGPRGTFRGQLYVAIDRHGRLTVANLVAESDLLAGLVPAEMFASAPAAALQAQAIAARGQLLGKIGTRHLDDPFLLCADQHCQVYAGASREDPRATSAVRKTRGHVLLRADGARLVDTVYSANSGGHTEDNDLVWPSPADPQLRGRPDPLVARAYPTIDGSNMERWLREAPRTYSSPESSQSASYRWTASVDLAALAKHPSLPSGLGTVRGIQVLERGRSGRALRVRVQAERGETDLIGELVIRRALGDLRSAAFVVLPELEAAGRVQLLGAGHGHGVGMCQHGAMGMGRAGLDCEQILAHYYPGGKLRSLW